MSEFRESVKEHKTILIFIVIMIIIFGIGVYGNRGWVKEFTCTNWVFLDEQSGIDGNKCVLENCARIKHPLNTFVEKCTCSINQKEVTKKCTDKQEVWRFTK